MTSLSSRITRSRQKTLSGIFIRNIYEHRKKSIISGKAEYTNIILDAIIKHNESVGAEEQLSHKEIVSNFELFQFAANDTSF